MQKAVESLQIAGVLRLSDAGECHWAGGNTTVVQLGDVLDRGDDEIGAPSAPPLPPPSPPACCLGLLPPPPLLSFLPACVHRAPPFFLTSPPSRPTTPRPPRAAGIVMLLRSLDAQARPLGGAVYMLNGNHESLNIAGDFRCASRLAVGLPRPWPLDCRCPLPVRCPPCRAAPLRPVPACGTPRGKRVCGGG